MTVSLDGIEVIIFDAYGTLFDTHSVVDALEADLPGHGEFLTQIWRLKQLEYSWLRTTGDDYEDFGVVTRDALRFSLATLEIAADAPQVEAWAAAYDRLTPYADVVPALRQLAGRRLAVFSNGSPGMLKALVGHAGMEESFEDLISVHAARAFKPSPKAYQLACDRFGLPPHRILLVSSNGFDLQGAGRFGMRTARIARMPSAALRARLEEGAIDSVTMFLALRSQLEAMGPKPDLSIGTLLELDASIDRQLAA